MRRKTGKAVNPILSEEEQRREWLVQLILDHEKEILRICYLYLRNIEDARDATQETFLRAYRHYGNFRGGSTVRTWLIKIAVNYCRDQRKSAWFRYVNRKLIPEQLKIPVPEPTNTGLELSDMVMNLPRKQMEVIALRYGQGLSVAETAEVLHISQAAVSLRCKHALENLKKELRKDEHLE